MSKKDLLIQEAKSQLNEQLNSGDREEAHLKADYILCDLLVKLGCEEVVAIFEKIPKWYA